MKTTEYDLGWDTGLVLSVHAILLILLFGVAYFITPLPPKLLGDIMGSLPQSGELLIWTGAPWEHPIIMSVLAIGFLIADGRIYPALCQSKGKKVGTLWGIGVTVLITVAIVWYAVVGRLFLNAMVEWRLR